ncbi:MAG: DNA replication and repair protein RecF [Pyrinomonadaceae bacterium]|nr:DNA replication and repair protein RecF [Pyrinomonadaceae bacterium]
MLLETLEAKKFRNLNGKMFCGNGLNIICGDNGHGKTNWLEAIYLLATTKSFRTTKLADAIEFDGDLAIVKGIVRQSAEIERTMQVALQANSKTLTVNGKREAVTRYLGQLHAVVFTASELEIVRGTPDARRKFLDGGITAIYPAYVQTLSDYNRVIKQKNSLLQSAQENNFTLEKTAELLSVWNEQLASLATKIHKARTRYVELLQASLEKKLFERETVTIRYVSSLEGKGDLSDFKALITERLALRVQAELSSGYSLIGVHRDDLEILFDNHDLRSFGSSGQQRSALLILQIAAIQLYFDRNNEYPLFLLDDIDAELDAKRTSKLLEFLEGKTQTFLTTSKDNLVAQFTDKSTVFRVESGVFIT